MRMEEIIFPHNQLIINTGETYTGIIFEPFASEKPSDYTLNPPSEATPIGPYHSAIVPGGSGWTEKPDTGGTSLTKDVPIGDVKPLFFLSMCYAIWKALHAKRRLGFFLLTVLMSLRLNATITELSFTPNNSIRGNETLIINPTIASIPEGSVQVCWGVYYDADCSYEVEDIVFSRAMRTGYNAVSCTMPMIPGTYYIKCSLQTGTLCNGTLDSYYVFPVVVYPTDADIVLTREAQGSASRINLTEEASKMAYGAMRFSKTTLNNAALSPYERYNYFISFPFDVQVANIYGIGEVGSHWLLYYYDGKGRAEEGFFAERTDNWVMIDDTDSILHAGQGYLLQLNSIQMAADNEEVWANNSEVATLFFPALSSISSIVTENETIPALSDAYECTIDLSATLGEEADRTKKDSYWRCIGVPSFEAPTGISELTYLYEWNPVDNSLNVASCDDFDFLPTQAYLVQNKGEIIWTDVSKPASVAAQHKEQNSFEWRLDLQQGETECDHTYIRFSEQASNNFDFGLDLCKEVNHGKANLYTYAGYERLAGNCIPYSDDTTIVRIGLQIIEDGEYSFYLSNHISHTEVILVDNENKHRTHLNALNYQVMLPAGEYKDRFSLHIAPISNAPTHIETDGVSTDERIRKAHKVLMNGILYIIRNGKMFTITGQEVK